MKELLAVAAISAAIATAIIAGDAHLAFTGYVEHVTDGDTLRMNGMRIRLWGIDAPEMAQPFGLDAKRKLAAFVLDQRIECHDKGSDRYKRTVAQCFLNGTDLGAYMISQGYAIDYTKYSGGFYRKQEDEARSERLGMHASGYIAPEEWRRTHQQSSKSP